MSAYLLGMIWLGVENKCIVASFESHQLARGILIGLWAGALANAMSQEANATYAPKEARLLHEYLALPLAESGVADSAKCLEWNLKWGPQERGTATVRDWHAYQNLLQLTGILTTADLGNARKVWDSVAEFVETRQLAEIEVQPARGQKSSFTTAHQLFQKEHKISQSPSHAKKEASPVQVGLGACSSRAEDKSTALSAEQLERIRLNREQALIRKSAKTRNEQLEGENHAVALLQRMSAEHTQRSLAYLVCKQHFAYVVQ